MQVINYQTFFPYQKFRENQEDIIKQIEHSIKAKKNILLVAPNGTGKTIIALSALLPIAIKEDLKIIYMCRTHSQNARVIKELRSVSSYLDKNGSNYSLSGLSIRGRNEMCLNKTLLSLKLNYKGSMSVCADLRKNKRCGHFLNLLKKRDNLENPILIAPEVFDKPFEAEELIKVCRDKNLCPYFLSKFLLNHVRVVICNYQWIFHPHIRKGFLKFIGKELEKCILVIDECHNIIDVATDINSQRLTPYILRLSLRDLQFYRAPVDLQNFLSVLITLLDSKKEEVKQDEVPLDPESFLKDVMNRLDNIDLNTFQNLITDLEGFAFSILEEKIAEGRLSRDFLGSVAEFWLKWLEVYLKDNYFFCYKINHTNGKSNIALEIVALDPREISTPVLNRCYSSLNLSGTVNPYVFNNLMGLQEVHKSYKGIIAGSPFDKKNIKALIVNGVSTKLNRRSGDLYHKMIEKIAEVITSTPANVGVFCASYKILRGLVKHNIESIVKKSNKKLFAEESGSTASENALLIENFKSMANDLGGGGVLLGVCGGRNSEGEDYPGDLMNSVVIAGFPYHLPTPRVNAKIAYYDQVFQHQGWNFAYLYPAVQRANQAAGRPIRKIDDKGAIIYLDSRFLDKSNWISDWIQEVMEYVPDAPDAIKNALLPFWQA